MARKYGMICGGRRQNDDVVAVGIEGVAPKKIDALAYRSHWIALGALSRLIEISR